MSKPWIVSVLSTAYDLKDYREKLISMLIEKKFEVSAYELPDFPVEYDKHSHDSCLIALRRVDIAITIIDKRSGGVYCGVEDIKKGVSITEAEYLKAIKEGIPVFSCVRKQAYDELHEYKRQFADYCKTNSISEVEKKEGRSVFDEHYVCTYVEKVQTLHFIEDIQNAYSENSVSNWMFHFTSIDDLIESVEGKLAGYSRTLMQELSERQEETLLNKHTSTSLGMSLRDVFLGEYYIEPPYSVESGRSLLSEESCELSSAVRAAESSILIHGEAGYGKTTVIAKCFSDHVEILKKEPSYNIPLFLPLKNKGCGYNFDLMEYIEEEFDEHFQKAPYPYLDINSIHFHFYCDGFDELAESLEEDDIERIRQSSIFKYPLVLTCRQQFVTRYLNVHNFSDLFGVRIQMQKWNYSIVEKYILNYCEKEGIKNKINILPSTKEDQDLQQLLDSPLLATMFLWYIEKIDDKKNIKEISRVKLFRALLWELSVREHSKRETLPSKTILNVWKFTAWELYLHRKKNEKLLREDLSDLIQDSFPGISADDVFATFDALFEWKYNCLTGTFHEQFMEYLVAELLIDACYSKQEPYPGFLKIVLRPEMNRYFRGIWTDASKKIKRKVFDAIEAQYFCNVGKTGDDSILTRVHAVYHLCRLEDQKREECINRAFETEKNVSVLLSLYFGAIKLGRLDKEEEFFQLLTQEKYSMANRGYHLTYYADIIQNGTLPYEDNGYSDWQGTLKALERHFYSNQLSHFFLWRIDLFTIKELLKERKKNLPLTDEIIEGIQKSVFSHKFEGYGEFYKKIENEMTDLLKEFKKNCEADDSMGA